MFDNNWYKEIIDRLDSIKDNIEPSDFRFYNITHLPIVIKQSLNHSSNCRVCKSNLPIIDEIVASFPQILTKNLKIRKDFDKKKNKIEQHLIKKHGLRFAGYYQSLYTLLGILTAITIALLINLINNSPAFNNLSIIAISIGLVVGRITGNVVDRKIYLKKMQL
jgi:hypothetical protein